MFQIAIKQSWYVWTQQNLFSTLKHDVTDGTCSISIIEWHLESEHQDPKKASVIILKEKKFCGCQNKGTAQACYCCKISPLKALLKSFKRFSKRYYKRFSKGITSMLLEFLCLHAFQLLPFLQGTQTWAVIQVPTEEDTICIPDRDYSWPKSPDLYWILSYFIWELTPDKRWLVEKQTKHKRMTF